MLSLGWTYLAPIDTPLHCMSGRAGSTQYGTALVAAPRASRDPGMLEHERAAKMMQTGEGGGRRFLPCSRLEANLERLAWRFTLCALCTSSRPSRVLKHLQLDSAGGVGGHVEHLVLHGAQRNLDLRVQLRAGGVCTAAGATLGCCDCGQTLNPLRSCMPREFDSDGLREARLQANPGWQHTRTAPLYI